MKKTLPLLIVNAVVVLALLATFGTLGLQRKEQTEVNRFTGVLEQNVTLRILENDTAKEKGFLKELLDAFNAEYAKLGITAVDANIGSFTDLEKLGPAGYGPDIVYQANDVLMKYAENKHIQPLPIEETELYSQIPQEAWSAYEANVDGIDYTFGVPINIQEPVLFYRKDLLPQDWQVTWDKNDDDIPDMIQTWNDLYTFSAQVKQESGGNKYGYMKSLNDQYFAAGYFISYGGYIFGQDEMGEYDTRDIGIGNGDAYKGARMIRDLAGIMDNNCASDTITTTAYELVGNGTYFATMSTPDVYGTFVENFESAWARSHRDWTKEQVTEYVKENLGVAKVPKLPTNGDITIKANEYFDMTVMGGINGYAVSSYTKSPNAAYEFVQFAARYEHAVRRAEVLGIAPAMTTAAQASGDISKSVYKDLMDDKIYIMPGERAMSQVWASLGSFLRYLAEDGLKDGDVYSTDEKIIEALGNVTQEIYDAIHTLS